MWFLWSITTKTTRFLFFKRFFLYPGIPGAVIPLYMEIFTCSITPTYHTARSDRYRCYRSGGSPPGPSNASRCSAWRQEDPRSLSSGKRWICWSWSAHKTPVKSDICWSCLWSSISFFIVFFSLWTCMRVHHLLSFMLEGRSEWGSADEVISML